MSQDDAVRPLRLFYSYSPADMPLRDALEAHLSPLKREGLVESWHERSIVAGMGRQAEIDRHIEQADIFLFLISPDFIASDYCYEQELRRALLRHESHTACVIPILVRPVDWQGTPLGKLKPLPANGMPVTLWSNPDHAWHSVVQSIRKVIAEHQQHVWTGSRPGLAAGRSLTSWRGSGRMARTLGAAAAGGLLLAALGGGWVWHRRAIAPGVVAPRGASAARPAPSDSILSAWAVGGPLRDLEPPPGNAQLQVLEAKDLEGDLDGMSDLALQWLRQTEQDYNHDVKPRGSHLQPQQLKVLLPLVRDALADCDKAWGLREHALVPSSYVEAQRAYAKIQSVKHLVVLLDSSPKLSGKSIFDTIDRFDEEVSRIETLWHAYYDLLVKSKPTSVAGALDLFAAYRQSIDGRTLLDQAHAMVMELRHAVNQDELTQPMLVSRAYLLRIYTALTEVGLAGGRDVLKRAERQRSGGRPDPAVVGKLAQAYLTAAKTRWEDSHALKEHSCETAQLAQSTTEDACLTYRLERKKLDHTLAHAADAGLPAGLMNLAAALSSYSYGARLLAEARSLPRKSELTALLDFADYKVREAAAGVHDATGTVPASIRAALLLARAKREGTDQDKLTALQHYWDASAQAQVAVLIARPG